MKYIQKPVIVDAVQFTEATRVAYHFDGGTLPAGVKMVSCHLHPPTRTIHSDKFILLTPNGGPYLEVGDWILTDADGERSVCKPDIFEATYEKVES